MKCWANACKAIGYLWLFSAGLIFLIGLVGVWITEGLTEIPRWLSPLQVSNWVIVIVATFPGLGLLLLASKLREEVSETEALVRAYSIVIEAAADALVVDEDRLPASKQKIKDAILELLQKTEDPKRRGALKNAYIDLAIFQSGVGPDPVRFEPSPTPAPEGYEAVVAVASSLAKRKPEIKHWSRVVAKESEQLLHELRSAGFGSEAGANDPT